MIPSEKGWFKSYLKFRDDLVIGEDYRVFLEKLADTQGIEEFLYIALQPTGMIYGFPISFSSVAHPQMEEWPVKEKMKIILVESMLHVGLYFSSGDDVGNDGDFCMKMGDKIADFYQTMYPNLTDSIFDVFGKSKDEITIAERIIDKRTNIKAGLSKGFWTGLFHNNLLFLDVIYFARWMQSPDAVFSEQMSKENEALRLAIVQLIGAAAHADGSKGKEDRMLFEFFLQSAQLPDGQEEAARDLFAQPISIDIVNLGHFNNWILRKFVLELCVLTIWADKVIEDSELEFVCRLNEKLGLEPEELEHSMIAIEGFVLENWDRVHYLENKHGCLVVSENLTKRMGLALRRSKKRLGKEVSESKELVMLLRKSTKEDLSLEEKAKVKSQLFDIMKTIPTLAIFLLPGGSVILPLIMKILPKHILYPTSFQD